MVFSVYVGRFGTGLGIAGILLGASAVLGSAIAANHRKTVMTLFLAAGLLGFACLTVFWTLPGLMLITAGVLEARSSPPGPANIA